MPYCSASDVRLLSGVTSDVVNDTDINSLIASYSALKPVEVTLG
jgi:hypothetical protein